MKIKLIKLFSVLLLTATVLTSCVTTKKENTDPNFLADMDPFNIGELVCFNKQNFFKPKPITVSVDFYPTFSGVAFSFKDGMNKILMVFTKAEYDALVESVKPYIELYETKALDPNYKPKKKNSFHRGKVNTYWGVTGYGRNVMAPYSTNYELLEVEGEKNPYFRIEVEPTDYPEEDHVSSPTISLYFTPSQAKEIGNVLNMDVIMEEINDFNDKAYKFE